MSRNKLIILLVLILGLGFFAYSYLSHTNDAQDAVPLSDSSVLPQTVGQDFIVLLNTLHSIKLDSTLFASPSFTSLHDSSVVVPLEPVGRRNPFAPLGAPDSF